MATIETVRTVASDLSNFGVYKPVEHNRVANLMKWDEFKDELLEYISANQIPQAAAYSQICLNLGQEIKDICKLVKRNVPREPNAAWSDSEQAAYKPANALLREITHHYGHGIEPFDLKMAFNTIEQRANESLKAYKLRVMLAAEKAGFDRHVAATKFFGGMYDRAFSKEAQMKRWSIDQAIERADMKEQATQNMQKGDIGFAPVNDPNAAGEANNVNNVGQGGRRKKKKKKKGQPQGQQNQQGGQRKGTCRYCGSFHTFGKIFCKASNIKCNYCQIIGHKEALCFRKKKGDERKDYSQQRPQQGYVQGQGQSSNKGKPWWNKKNRNGGVNNVDSNDDGQGQNEGQGPPPAANAGQPGIGAIWGLQQ